MPTFDVSEQKCPVCNRNGTTFSEVGDRDYRRHVLYTVICLGCGVFEIDLGDFGTHLQLTDPEKLALSAIIRKYNDEVGTKYPLSALEQYRTNLQSSQAPIDVVDQIDIILTHISKKAPYIG